MIEKLNYMLCMPAGVGTTQQGFPVRRSLYFIPKVIPGAGSDEVGVLGGTFVRGADSKTPNENEYDLLLNNAREFFGWSGSLGLHFKSVTFSVTEGF